VINTPINTAGSSEYGSCFRVKILIKEKKKDQPAKDSDCANQTQFTESVSVWHNLEKLRHGFAYLKNIDII